MDVEKAVTDCLDKQDKINKRLVATIIAIVITFCTSFVIIFGFLYLGKTEGRITMIEKMSPRSGRVLREDDSVVNIADMFPGIVSGKVVGTGTAQFAACDANTLQEVTITPEGNIKSALRLEVENPSSESDLTVEVYDTLGSKDYFVAWFTIPRKTTRANGKEVQAHTRQLPAVGCRGKIKVVLSNDQAIATGFTANITIREV